MCNFHVGQKVVCVWNFSKCGFGDEQLPAKGEVYTIRGMEFFPRTGMVGLVFEEFHNKPRHYSPGLFEAHFAAERFRPVKTTSIEVFTAMLAPTPRLKETV